MNEAGSLASVWPPADAQDGDYRRAPLAGTRLKGSLGLGDGSRVVALAWDAASSAWAIVPVVADPGATGGWRRALPGDGVAAALVAALADGGGPLHGGFRLEVVDAAAAAAKPAPAAERAVGVDQTNESVVVGERLAVKWLLHPDPARERGPRLLRHLVAAGFREVPRLVGLLTWAPDPGAPSMTVALIDVWLPDARDGWDWCTDAVLAHAHPTHRCDGACPAGFAAALGALMARLHVALATPTAVIPDPVTVAGATAVAGWASTAHRALADALALTTADDPAAGADLAGVAGMLEARLARLATIERTKVQPIHGDLHVGQVLRGSHGLAVIDLDGNPTAEAASLQAPAPAARDVAGMQCSLDHVGRIAIRRGAPPAVVDAWIAEAQTALLKAYRAALDEAGRSALLDQRLLEPFRVEQECRELIYAARFLPRWRYAPMAAIRAMVSA